MQSSFSNLFHLISLLFLGSAYTHAQIPLSNLQCWLKADVGISVADSTPIDTWLDQSGNNYHATASGAFRPTLRNDFLNQLPAVQFDGTNMMTLPLMDLSNTDKIELVVLYRTTGVIGAGSTAVVFENSPNMNLSTTGFGFFDKDRSGVYDPNGAVVGFVGDMGSGSYESTSSADSFLIANIIIDKSLPADEAIILFCGDTIPGDAYGGNADNTNNFGINESFIGARSGGLFGFTGEIAEILLYSQKLDSVARDSVWTYLADKYLVCSSLQTSIDLYPTPIASQITVFPNPTHHNIQIVVEAQTFINVYDIYGKLLLSKSLFPGNNELNLSDLKAGVYLITDNKSWNYKLVKTQ